LRFLLREKFLDGLDHAVALCARYVEQVAGAFVFAKIEEEQREADAGRQGFLRSRAHSRSNRSMVAECTS
jgi:hypothetical protein